MDNLWARFGIVSAAVLGGFYVLAPTLLQGSDLAGKAAEVGGGETAASGPAWMEYLPESKMVLGIDLQGGIDLTLEVDVEEAIAATVSRDIAPIESLAEADGVGIEEIIKVRGAPSLEIRPATGVDLEAIRGVVGKRGGTYAYASTRTDESGTWHRFDFVEAAQARVAQQSVEQAVDMIRDRIDETGVKEPSITRKGDSQISVQLPGADNLEEATAALSTTAVLEFFLVDEEFEEVVLSRALESAKAGMTPELYADDEALNDWLIENGKIGRKNRLLWEYEDTPDGKEIRKLPVILKDEVILTGDDVSRADVNFNPQTNEPYVALEFKPQGAQVFAQVTGDNVGKRFAIVLDRKVRSAPNIREKIGGGRASIEMGTQDPGQAQADAQMLSLVLRTGALPAPVAIGEVRVVGPSLGADAIFEGQLATAVGSGLVVLAMLVFYRVIGLYATVCIVLNVFFMMSSLAAFGATLSLPGLAGIALTVAMAVDGNIIIFERIREELRAGKAARAAVDSGYENAFSAVLDGNLTNAIAAVVLYSYGSGPIKGFAVTSLIGIFTTLFSAVYVSRLLLDWHVKRTSKLDL